MARKNPMPTVEFEWSPTPIEVAATFDRIGRTLQTSFIDDLVRAGYPDDLAELIRNRTKAGVSSKGGKFKPYAPLTIAIRAFSGLGGNVDLSFSGSMLESITGRRKGRFAIELFLQGARNERIGTFQQFGTSARGKIILTATGQIIGFPGERVEPGIPARPFMGLRPSDEILATGIANRVFQAITVPRLINAVVRSFK